MQEQEGKFFYGWVIVFAGLALSLIMYGVVDAFGIVFKPISEEFHWDRGTVSVSSMVNWISFGLGNLLFGTLTDRFGSRRVMIVGGVIFVVGVLLMSQIHSVWHLYLFFGVLIAIGRSAAGVPLTALVTRWFTKNQGLALALVQSQNVGSAVFAPLTVLFLGQYGWRGAYIGLGTLALLIIPLAFLMQDYAAPQTEGTSTSSSPGTPTANLTGMTLGEAMKTRAFWTLNMMVIGCCTCHSCILLHGVNHMTDVGLSVTTASHVVAVMAIFGMIGKVANGLLADKVGAKWSMAGFLFLQAITIPVFIHAHEVPTFYMWAALFGTGFGGPMPVYAMLFREYFGIRYIGSILGVFFMVAALGRGFGSMMGGLLYNIFGSYAIPFFTSTTTGLIAAFLRSRFRQSRNVSLRSLRRSCLPAKQPFGVMVSDQPCRDSRAVANRACERRLERRRGCEDKMGRAWRLTPALLMECWGVSADRQHWERFEQDALHDAGKGKMRKSGVAMRCHNNEMRLDIHDLVIGLYMNHVEFGCAV